MLQETKTEGTISFFVTFLLLVSFQLGEVGWAGPLSSSPAYTYAKVTQEFEIVEQQLIKLTKIKIVLFLQIVLSHVINLEVEWIFFQWVFLLEVLFLLVHLQPTNVFPVIHLFMDH